MSTAVSQMGREFTSQRPSIHQTSLNSERLTALLSLHSSETDCHGQIASTLIPWTDSTTSPVQSNRARRPVCITPVLRRAMLTVGSPRSHIYAWIRVSSEFPGLRENVKSPESRSYIRGFCDVSCGDEGKVVWWGRGSRRRRATWISTYSSREEYPATHVLSGRRVPFHTGLFPHPNSPPLRSCTYSSREEYPPAHTLSCPPTPLAPRTLHSHARSTPAHILSPPTYSSRPHVLFTPPRTLHSRAHSSPRTLLPHVLFTPAQVVPTYSSHIPHTLQVKQSWIFSPYIYLPTSCTPLFH